MTTISNSLLDSSYPQGTLMYDNCNADADDDDAVATLLIPPPYSSMESMKLNERCDGRDPAKLATTPPTLPNPTTPCQLRSSWQAWLYRVRGF